MDTTTAPEGELLFHIAGALAQFERRLNAERSRAGIEAARRRGKHLGRPAELTPEKIAHARKAIDSGRPVRHRHGEVVGVHRHPAQGPEKGRLNFPYSASRKICTGLSVTIDWTRLTARSRTITA